MPGNVHQVALPFYLYEPNAFKAGEKYSIDYLDSVAKLSKREILVNSASYLSDGETELDAFCLLANSRRTFISSRIKSATSLTSGEVLKPKLLYQMRFLSSEEISRDLRKVGFDVTMFD